MAEKIKKNDFVEIEFIGRVEGGEIFDTNIEQELNKINPEAEARPLIICIGHEMILAGLDKNLPGKQLNKEYEIKLSPQEAFGVRNPALVKIMNARIFFEKNINPQPGLAVNLDGILARILAVSGGRVIVDFNNPLASKTIIYKFKIKRIVQDINEKVNALMEFFLKKKYNFEIKDKKICIEASKDEQKFIKLFEEKFKDILHMEIMFVESSEKSEES